MTRTENVSPGGPAPRPLRRVGFSVGLLLCVVTSALLVAAPEAGAPLFATGMAIFCLVIIVAPWTHGLRPRVLAALPSLAGASFLTAMISGVLPYDVDYDTTVRPLDGFVFLAYALLGTWMFLLARRVAPGQGLTTLLDVAAAAIGACLALWTVAVGAMVGGQRTQSALLIASYPMLDIILVTLAVHLSLRMARFTPAMGWLLGSLVWLLVLDATNGVLLLTLGDASAVFAAGQIFGFFGFAVTASHPRLVDLSRPNDDPTVRREGRERIVLILLTLTPAVLAAGIPPESGTDGIVRATLVAALLAVVSFRLWRTLATLSASESRHFFRATHDHLTGLLNRSALMDELESRLERDAAHGHTTAAMFLDLDRFKEINDTWGHDVGDALLTHVAEGLPHRLRRDDVLARQGGDEFVILASVEHPDDVPPLADRVMAFFERPVMIAEGHGLQVSPSIGVATTTPGERVRGEELITRADEAMYRAKRQGRGRWAMLAD